MADRYPGTTSPSLERRFKAILKRIAEIEKRQSNQTTKTTRRVIVSEQDTSDVGKRLSQHIANIDPHPQYLNDDRAADWFDSHKAEDDPHEQYLLEVEAGEEFDDLWAAIGDALDEALQALLDHEAAVDPHPQYNTGGFDDSDIDGGVAGSHYLGLFADGGGAAPESLTEGVLDGGSAVWP